MSNFLLSKLYGKTVEVYGGVLLIIRKQPALRQVTRGAFYLYLSTMISNVLGYVFWLVIFKLTTPYEVGLASTATSIAIILGNLTIFGIPIGIQRFLGKTYVERDLNSLKSYFFNGLTILMLSSGSLTCLMIILSRWLTNFTNIPTELLIVSSLIIFTNVFSSIFYALFISILRTDLVTYVNAGASVCRLIAGILLVLIGFGAFGIIFGYFTLSLVSLITYLILSFRIVGFPRFALQMSYIGELLKAGGANWLPSVVQILGMQLGVIAVYGFMGAFQAGQYFIAYAIANVVFAIPYSFLSVMFPVLSGMENGRKRVSWKAIKLILSIVVPITVILAIYSKVVLGFFGSSYVEGWLILTLLLIGVAPFAIVQGVNILAYAYGFYGIVLSLGVVVSLPRTLLYLFLTPWFGGVGAAEAFLTGTITGTVCAIIVAKKIGLVLDWKALATIFFIPATLGLFSYFLALWWFLGAPLILITSMLVYARLKVITKKDLAEIARGFLPERIYKIGIEKLGWIIKMVYGE
jgi:O-antigen/teichoic acid export membrane protein